MTIFTDAVETVIERKKRVKFMGEFKDRYVLHTNHSCRVMENGLPYRRLLIFAGDIDVLAGDRCVAGADVYEVVSVQHHFVSGENETVAVCDHDKFETGMKKLEELGCDIKFGKIVSTAKDPEAEDFMDSWVGTFIKNIVAHYDQIKTGRHIGELFGLFNHDIPAVCVGAGPSLDKNAHLLYEFPGVIICADRAYKMLRARGIEPDIVLSVDCHYDLVPDFLDWPGSFGHLLVLNTCSDPKVMDVWKGKVFWSLMKHPGVQFMDRILPALFPTFGGLENAGNVGNSSVLLADHIGFSPVFLIGQDYGYTGGKMMGKQYKFSKKKAEEVEVDHARLLEERSGKTDVDGTLTYFPFLSYRDTLYHLREKRGIDVINCTEGGILKKLPNMPFSEVIGKFPMKQSYTEAKKLLKEI